MNNNNKAAVSTTRQIAKRLTMKMKQKNQLNQKKKLINKKMAE
jgi:hypothetical protein